MLTNPGWGHTPDDLWQMARDDPSMERLRRHQQTISERVARTESIPLPELATHHPMTRNSLKSRFHSNYNRFQSSKRPLRTKDNRRRDRLNRRHYNASETLPGYCPPSMSCECAASRFTGRRVATNESPVLKRERITLVDPARPEYFSNCNKPCKSQGPECRALAHGSAIRSESTPWTMITPGNWD